MKQVGLKIAGVTVGCLLLWATAAHVKRRRQDRRATILQRRIAEVTDPSTKGLQAEKALDVHYAKWAQQKAGGRIFMLKKKGAQGYALQLHKGFAPWYLGGDRENKLYAVFRKLKDKVQVSQVAAAYQGLYGVNLIDKLHDRLSDAEIAKVLDIIGSLTQYRIPKVRSYA